MIHNLIKNSRLSYPDLYILIVGVLTFCKAVGLDGDSVFYKFCVLMSTILWIVKLASEKWSIKRLSIFILMLTIVFANFMITRQVTLILSFILFTGSRNVKLESILECILRMRVIGFFLIVILVLTRVIPNGYHYFWRDGVTIVRYSFGYSHPNLFHSSYLLIVLLVYYLYSSKINVASLIVVLVINYIMFSMTASRTSYYLVIIHQITFALSKSSGIFRQFLFRITKYIQFFLLSVTVILGMFYVNSEVYMKVDKLLTGRFTFVTQQLKEVPNLLGRNFSNTNILFDNSYSQLLSVYGLIISAVFFYLYYLTAKRQEKSGNFPAILLFFNLSILFFTESYITSAIMNYIIYFSAQIYNDLDRKIIKHT